MNPGLIGAKIWFRTHLLLHEEATPVGLLLVHLVDVVPLCLVETLQPETDKK